VRTSLLYVRRIFTNLTADSIVNIAQDDVRGRGHYAKCRLNIPRGARSKREHEYQELKTEFEKEERYSGREEEVTWRIYQQAAGIARKLPVLRPLRNSLF
jgi:hypothetical protein